MVALFESTVPVLAVVSGKPVTEVPADLFIPPDALEILLDAFSGPLDLLLYLIRRQNIDILNIPIVHITQQYMQYIHLMEQHRIELAADYLVMAAQLAEIKSRLLLPQSPDPSDEVEEDPRLALVKKLQMYEQFKQAAIHLDELPRCDRDYFRFSVMSTEIQTLVHLPEVSLPTLVETMQGLIQRQGHEIHHQIMKEPLSVKERMGEVLEALQQKKSLFLTELLKQEEGRMGVAVTFLAILELARQSLVVITQTMMFSPIHLQAIHHG